MITFRQTLTPAIVGFMASTAMLWVLQFAGIWYPIWMLGIPVGLMLWFCIGALFLDHRT
jgi:hypothetical protein